MSILKTLRAAGNARGRSETPSCGLAARVRRPQVGWIGVDLGTSAIKLAQVERRDGACRMTRSVVVPVTHDGGAVLNAAAQQQIRRAVRGGLTFSGRAAAAVAPSSLLDFRTLDLPNGSPAELRQIIAQELDDSDGGAGAGAGPCEFAFWKTSKAAGGPAAGPVSVSVLAVPQAEATNIAEGLFAAGVECEVLDAPPFALARAVRLAAPQASDRPQAALDWGFHSVVFTLVVDGRPAFTRAFRDCGLRHLLDSVAGGLGLSPAESRQILSSCGVPVPRAGAAPGRVESAVGELAAPVLNRLVSELRRTIAFLKQQSGGGLERIWLCGGGGLIRNMAVRLTSEIGVATQVWRLHRAADDERPDDPAECLFAMAVALSALRWENAR